MITLSNTTRRYRLYYGDQYARICIQCGNVIMTENTDPGFYCTDYYWRCPECFKKWINSRENLRRPDVGFLIP